MVGTLKLIGEGRWPVERIEAVLAARDRAAAGPTAPACGLYLCGSTIGWRPGSRDRGRAYIRRSADRLIAAVEHAGRPAPAASAMPPVVLQRGPDHEPLVEQDRAGDDQQ